MNNTDEIRYLHSKCHPQAPTWVSVEGRILIIECSICGEELICLELKEPYKE